MRRWPIIGLSLLAVCAAFAVLDPFEWLPGTDLADGEITIGPERDTATASVQSLSSTFEAEGGEIVFVGEVTVIDSQIGTIGWIVEPESTVQAGDVLYERDLQPVTLMTGDEPAWRSMSVDDVGQDVAQLEANLANLGYGTETEFTIDDTFTEATAAIVRRWQADLGVEETGTVALGDVVFGPDVARVGTTTAAIGDASNGLALLTLSSLDREIQFEVTTESIGSISTGSEVSARLPDRSTTTGIVQAIAPTGSGVSLVSATITIGDDQTLPVGDSIPVTVSWTEVLASETVTIPASAVLRLDDGRYAVEKVDPDGEITLATVEVGQQVGGLVGIVSGLDADQVVVSP